MVIAPTVEQLAVINHHLPGHGRVLAGPGTGKSTIAVGLANRLINDDSSIRLRFLTFTRAATIELSKKLSGIPTGGIERPSTIHSFSIGMLIRNPGCASFPEPLRIPDKYEFEELIRPHLARAMGVTVWDIDDLINEMASKWESLVPTQSTDISAQTRAKFIGLWQEHRKIFGYTLLQELPDLFRCALRDHEDLEGVDYDLLIVDEYQDLNACDLEVIKRLANHGASVLAIGDDDQSIYSFRKAHPIGIRRFLREYKTTNDYKLTICHRSAPCIISWAQHVISGDTERELRGGPSCRLDAPSGIAELLHFKGEISEANGVANLVKWLIEEKGVSASDILVLSRSDLYGRFTKPIKEKLINLNIRISDSNVVDEILADERNFRLITLLRLLANRTDSLAWWDFLKLEKGIGNSFVDEVSARAKTFGISFGKAFTFYASRGFEDFSSSRRNKASVLWQTIEKQLSSIILPEEENVDWSEWIINEIENKRLPDCSSEFKELLMRINEEIESGEELARFLSQIRIIGKDILGAESEGVRFMTIGKAKGLTVRATIVVGVENDIIPRPFTDPQEERRLLYVAMTRSQEFLFLTWANRRRGPTARSGRPNVIGRRQVCEFLNGGPIQSKNGDEFLSGLFS